MSNNSSKVDKLDKILPHKVHKYSLFTTFFYAFSGLKYGFLREPNLSVQLSLGLFLAITGIIQGRWILAMAHLLIMGMIMSMELMNTAVEHLCDLIEEKYSLKVKAIKDISAGSVFLLSLIWLILIGYQLIFSATGYF